MFTGVIEEVGRVAAISRVSSGARIKIECAAILNDLKIGDSVSVAGACLTVADIKNGTILFDAAANTMAKTSLGRFRVSEKVNLERAVKAGDRLGGHIVTGHVDGERIVKKAVRTSMETALDVGILRGDEKYLVPRGSVAIDGVSLTVAGLHGSFFRAYLIPLTLEKTTLRYKKAGDRVNVEFDILAKYAVQQRGRE